MQIPSMQPCSLPELSVTSITIRQTMNQILLLLEHAANRSLLADALRVYYEVVSETPTPAALDAPFDLCILDGPALDKLWEAVRACKRRAEPRFLPFLLVTPRQDVGLATRHLWQTVDEVILAPIERVELHARVANLLLIRQMSAEFHRVMLQELPNAVIVLAADQKVHFWSRAASVMLGWSEAETLGRPLPDLWLDRQRWHTLFQNALQGQTAVHQELELRRKDGQLLVAEVSLALIHPFHHANHGSYVVASLNDISARRQADAVQRRRLAELEALNRVTLALQQAHSVETALSTVLHETLAILDLADGAIWLYRQASGSLHIAAACGWLQALRDAPVRPGEGLAGRAFAGGEILVASEATCPLQDEAAFAALAPHGWSGVWVPIHAPQASIGVLAVVCQAPRQIQPDEIQLLESLARITGITLQRMQLYEQTQKRLKELATLHIIDLAIVHTTDIAVTMEICSSQIFDHFKADALDIRVFNAATNTLECVARRGFVNHIEETVALQYGASLAERAALERRSVQSSDVDAAAWNTLAACEGFGYGIAVPLIARGELKGVLELFYRSLFRPKQEWMEFLNVISQQVAIAIDSIQSFQALRRSREEIEQAYNATIEGWSRALDLRDKATEGHSLRVTAMTLKLAQAAGMSEQELVHVRRGALLHDIGKIAIPDTILLKQGPLTDEEWAIMQRHPQYAFDMLAPIEYLRPALDIPYCHHEKWDGSGYPRGLRGEQIPLAARIFAVVDVWDALTNTRPYRQAWSHEQALSYIKAQAGAHFDPEVVDLFLQLLPQLLS